MNIGDEIRKLLREQGRTVTWFADQLCCSRMNVYKIFQRDSIETSLLFRISKILEHDLFYDLSKYYVNSNL